MAEIQFTASATGFSRYRNTALAATKSAVKSGLTVLHGMKFINPNTVPVYVKFYPKSSGGVTVGTDTPQRTELVPAGNGTTPGLLEFTPDGGAPIDDFADGLTIACVTGLADSSTTAPSTAIHAELQYK